MMERFTCPDHGRLVVRLSLGRLDDAEALRAERAAESCPHCALWWHDTLAGDAAAVAVDHAVSEGFASFRAPRRATRRWWLAAAAAALVTLGAGTVWWQQRATPTPTSAEVVAGPGVPTDAVLARWDFEDGEIEVVEAVVAPAPPTREPARSAPAADTPPPVLHGGFESGDLSGWSSHT